MPYHWTGQKAMYGLLSWYVLKAKSVKNVRVCVCVCVCVEDKLMQYYVIVCY